MKTKDILIFIGTLGVGYLVYKKYVEKAGAVTPSKKKKEMPKVHCNPDFETVFICNGKIYCCKELHYIINEINNTEPPLRILYLLCVCTSEGCKVIGDSKDFTTRDEAIQWVRANSRKVCFQTVYTLKGRRGVQPPHRKYIYPI